MIRLVLLLALLGTAAHGAPLIVAHRGASHHAPGNTLPAFKLAWKKGAGAIEADFHLTKDGHIVCTHDADTKKAAGKRLVVANSTLAELRALDVGIRKGAQWEGTRIPTFAEVAATVPDGRQFFIEIKCGPEIIPPLLKQIAASGIPRKQITIIAFDAAVIKAAKSAAPDIRANWLCQFKKNAGFSRPRKSTVLSTLKSCGADGLSTNAWETIDAPFIAQVRAAGCSYHVWTINSSATACQFRDLGADSITTDLPAHVRGALEAP